MMIMSVDTIYRHF